MADDTRLKVPSGATDGDLIKTLDDGTRKWPVGVTAYVTSLGDPDVLTIPVAAALGDDAANPTTPLHGACLLVFDGTGWDRARGTSADGMLVDLGANNDVRAKLATDGLVDGATVLTPKFAAISANTSGNSTVVAAVPGKKIRVLSYRFQADADVSVKFRDNTAGADLTGAMATGAKGGGGGAAFSPVGHFETQAGNALSINLSGALQVSGHLCYVEV